MNKTKNAMRTFTQKKNSLERKFVYFRTAENSGFVNSKLGIWSDKHVKKHTIHTPRDVSNLTMIKKNYGSTIRYIFDAASQTQSADYWLLTYIIEKNKNGKNLYLLYSFYVEPSVFLLGILWECEILVENRGFVYCMLCS